MEPDGSVQMEMGSLDRRRRRMKELMKLVCEAIQLMQETGMILYHRYLAVVTVTDGLHDSAAERAPVARL
jgi:hypothetical protein